MHQEAFSTVQIRPASKSYSIGTRARSHSIDEQNQSLNQTARNETMNGPRGFMRVWVTVTKV